MAFGIGSIAYTPLREEPRESSQMVSSLLFGETFEVLESRDSWHYVRVTYDGYEGWLFTRSHVWIPELPNIDYLAGAPFLEVVSGERKLNVGLGAPLPECTGDTFQLGKERFSVKGEVVKVAKRDFEQVRRIAERFLETPYLWGGRCGFGIDCSGFTQVLMRYTGIAISRDAKDQIHEGKVISNKDAEKGDLAFFHNEDGKITHSGFIESPDQIIHASGKVRKDAWDEKGIYNEELGTYTHDLYGIRRF